jgi:citrate lyase subunit beta / citryl-CoA lyase
MLQKAPSTGADVVVFDLEDAVAPARKAEAREAVATVLAEIGPDSEAELIVRLTRETYETDLDRVADAPGLDGVMLPKVETSDRIEAVRAHPDGTTLPVIALVESARGVLAAPEIAMASPVTAVCFGAEDLAADIGAERTAEGTEVLYARERVVLAASAAGVDAIDTVFTDIEGLEALRAETAVARGLGYDGKMAIHPAQVPVINSAFVPDDERIAWAKRVLDARESEVSAGAGVFRVDGEMIDAPLVAQAERVLTLARAAEE